MGKAGAGVPGHHAHSTAHTMHQHRHAGSRDQLLQASPRSPGAHQPARAPRPLLRAATNHQAQTTVLVCQPCQQQDALRLRPHPLFLSCPPQQHTAPQSRSSPPQPQPSSRCAFPRPPAWTGASAGGSPGLAKASQRSRHSRALSPLSPLAHHPQPRSPQPPPRELVVWPALAAPHGLAEGHLDE